MGRDTMIANPAVTKARREEGHGWVLGRGKKREHRLLLVGRNQRTRRHLNEIDIAVDQRVSVIGFVDDCEQGHQGVDDCSDLFLQNQVPHLGRVSDLASVLRDQAVDEVLITLPIKSCYDQIQATMQLCEEAGVPVSLCTDLFGNRIARPDGAARAAHKIVYTCTPYPRWKLGLKRLMDIAGALAALSIFALPMLVIAIAIKLTSRGPLLFKQSRSGQNHRKFDMLKFRTMVPNAEKLKQEMQHLNEVDGPVFKIKKDPRVTPIGRFLRKYSLDELPQLFNVLRGEMSLVGPRPPIPREVENYEWWQRRRLSMKPGLTCFWQVSGRNDVGFEEWMQMDLAYIDNWSLGLDVKLLVKTVPAVVRGRGAS